MYQALYNMMCMAYAQILRRLLKTAIDDPNEVWDEWVLQLCDNLFNYKP